MRRFLSILRKPVVLLLAFAAWVGFFSWMFGETRYRPRYEFATTDDHQRYLASISNDGTKVFRHSFDWFHGDDGRVHVWDAPTGEDLTPDENNPGRTVACYAYGIGILQDDSVWPIFREKLVANRQKAVAEWSKKFGPLEVDRVSFFPRRFGFSDDLRYYWYETYDGIPVHCLGPPHEIGPEANGVAVDEMAAGKRIASLPTFYSICFSPDGQTAALYNWKDKGEDGKPLGLILWDLHTSRQRGNRLVESSDFSWCCFSSDGRFLFACSREPRQVQWWDTATTQRRGTVDGAENMAVVEQGRILVTLAVQIKEQPAANNQLARDQLLFWSTADGKLLSEIDLGLHWRLRDCPRDGLSCSNNSRWVAFHFDPIDFHREAPSKPFWLFRFLFPNQPSKDAAQILLIDAMERREIAFLPGRSATFSPNGRWLATIDADGIVRVWELPLRRPWFRIFGFAAIATLACALAFGIIRWSFRRVSSA